MPSSASKSLNGKAVGGGLGEEEVLVKDTVKMYRKISWRLLPLFFCMVILCYVDRCVLLLRASV